MDSEGRRFGGRLGPACGCGCVDFEDPPVDDSALADARDSDLRGGILVGEYMVKERTCTMHPRVKLSSRGVVDKLI
jgi:hypothetical protein